MSTEETEVRVRTAAVRATVVTAAMVGATFVPVLNYFALLLFSMPLALFQNIDSVELGRAHGEYMYNPTALGYVLGSVVIWIVSFFLFFSSLPRRRTRK